MLDLDSCALALCSLAGLGLGDGAELAGGGVRDEMGEREGGRACGIGAGLLLKKGKSIPQIHFSRLSYF